MDQNVTPDLEYEDTLLHIFRALPPQRAEQLLDFARFLESQRLAEDLFGEEDEAGVEGDDARWDALLASAEGQTLLDQLTEEALAEHRAGKTRPMAFDDEGRIVPG